MSGDKQFRRRSRSRLPVRQDGVAAVEFALLSIIFLTLLFGIMEVARIAYVANTLQEVTRRAAAAAANSSFDQRSVDRIRQRSLFRDSSGNLILANFVTPNHLKVEYLSISRNATTGALTPQPASPMPACPGQNYINCMTDPYGSSCIRLVRVSVCQPGGTGACNRVPYQELFSFVDFSMFALPRSTTIVPAQTLGRTFGALPCP